MIKHLLKIIFILCIPVASFANTAGLWSGGQYSTSFNSSCADWTYPPDSMESGCDGVRAYLNSSLDIGIKASANSPNGEGGKGFFWEVGNGGTCDHTAPSGSVPRWDFPSAASEFWFKIDFRFPSGYPISTTTLHYWKIMYAYNSSNSWYLDTNTGNQISLYTRHGTDRYTGNFGFDDVYPGGVSDGSWHAVEFHFNMATGLFEYWFYVNGVDDPTPKYSTNSVVYNISNVTYFKFPENVKTCNSYLNTVRELHFDDIVISTTGRIGPGSPAADSNSPLIANQSPSGAQNCIEADSTQDMTVSFTASDASPTINCELGTVSNFIFGTGIATSPSAGGSGAVFSHTFTDQACGASYNHYPKCRDSAASPNTTSNAESAAAVISYSIGTYSAETDPPVVTLQSPSSGSELVCIYNPRDVIVQALATDATPPIELKISSINNFDYDTQGSVMTPQATGGSGDTFSYIFNGGNQLACDASYLRYIKARDAEGNTSAQIVASFSIAAEGTANLLLSESFEDSSFSSRGWRDGSPTSAAIASGGINGNCAKFTFAQGNTTPNGWSTIRKDFTPSEELTYVVWWKFANDYVGSGTNSQPHVIYTLSDVDSSYSALAKNYLNIYIESNALVPRVEIQDNLNINYSQGIPYDFANPGANQSESRSVNKCNGYLSTQSNGSYQDCFSLGGGLYYSATHFNGNAPFTRNEWNKDEIYVRLNSVVNGKAIANGIIERKVNNVTVMYENNVVMRTGANPGLKLKQLVVAPYISSPGSPVDQTLYIDELSVFNGRLITDPAPTTPGRFGLTNINSGNTGISAPGAIPATVYP